MKFYEFRYKSKSAKISANILNVIGCFLYPQFITIFFLFVLSILGVNKFWPNWCAPVLIINSFILGFVFVVRYFKNYKGVFICDDCIEINRYSITDFHPIPNFKIYYKDIKCIYNSRQVIPMYSRKAKKVLVSGCDLSYYIEIGLVGGKEFYFSVESQEEFAEELLNRINKYRLENHLDEL